LNEVIVYTIDRQFLLKEIGSDIPINLRSIYFFDIWHKLRSFSLWSHLVREYFGIG